MKNLIFIFTACLAFAPLSYANEPTTGEKVESAMDSAGDKAKEMGRKSKRMAKKGAHRVEEAVCMKGDAKCAAEKAKNRMEEGKDATVDAAKGVKDKMSH